MKKFRIPSLLATIFLCSLLVYSCMKDDVMTQKPASIEAKQVQVISPTSDIADKPLPIETVNKKLQVSNAVSKAAPSSIKATFLSSVENDECDAPKDTKKCTTQQGSMNVTMPATALNPFPSVASVSYTYTICFDNKGNATISYRNVDAIPNVFPHPLFDHWISLPSPAVEQAIDEYTINAANKVEDILTQQFFVNYPNAQILESRYYRALCYTTCMFLKEGVATAARTTCGDKCCKRVRIWSKNPNGPALTQESFETNGGVCAGGTSSPCQNPIVITSICSHECAPRFD